MRSLGLAIRTAHPASEYFGFVRFACTQDALFAPGNEHNPVGSNTADPKSPLYCAVFCLLSTFCTQCPIGACSTGDSALRCRAKYAFLRRWIMASGSCTGAALCPTRRSPTAFYQSRNGIINCWAPIITLFHWEHPRHAVCHFSAVDRPDTGQNLRHDAKPVRLDRLMHQDHPIARYDCAERRAQPALGFPAPASVAHY